MPDLTAEQLPAARFCVLSWAANDDISQYYPDAQPPPITPTVCHCGHIDNPVLLCRRTQPGHSFSVTDESIALVLRQQPACEFLLHCFTRLVDSRQLCLTCESGKHVSASMAAVLADWCSRLLGPTLLMHWCSIPPSADAKRQAISNSIEFANSFDGVPGEGATPLVNGEPAATMATATYAEHMRCLIRNNPIAYFGEPSALPPQFLPKGLKLLPTFESQSERDRLLSTWQRCLTTAAKTCGSFRHIGLHDIEHQLKRQKESDSAVPKRQSATALHARPPTPPTPPAARSLGPRVAPVQLPSVVVLTPLPTPVHPSIRLGFSEPAVRHEQHGQSAYDAVSSRSHRSHRSSSRQSRHRRRSRSRVRGQRTVASTCTDSCDQRGGQADIAKFCLDNCSDIMTRCGVPPDVQTTFHQLLRGDDCQRGTARHDDLIWLIQRQWQNLNCDGKRPAITHVPSWFKAALSKYLPGR